MKLTRTVHVGGVQVFFAPAAELLPDIRPVEAGDGSTADQCLLFVDAGSGEAHGFLFTEEQAHELAGRIMAPKIEVVRTFPGGLLGNDNGDVPA